MDHIRRRTGAGAGTNRTRHAVHGTPNDSMPRLADCPGGPVQASGHCARAGPLSTDPMRSSSTGSSDTELKSVDLVPTTKCPNSNLCPSPPPAAPPRRHCQLDLGRFSAPSPFDTGPATGSGHASRSLAGRQCQALRV
ncbi:hypothetical protein ACCO45_003195 [Purpureocillium lilacinum]|uniref:Uncharacterized protein n=1 Tax=Purpureocillium lilacinum TaxID=33203 RepID=A0ACC4DZB3_PURLI